jgi:hypothetical protein
MIYFAVPEESLPMLGRYLECEWGAPMVGKLQLVTYESIFETAKAERGVWILAAVDRLTPAGLDLAQCMHDSLIANGLKVLNSPKRVLLRYDLLRKLYGSGRNRFRGLRVSEYRGDLRFPVFIREENDHNGDLCGLLHSDVEVREALAALRMRGQPLEDLLIVEFCDTSVDGIFRKYSAFYVDGVVLPRNLQASTQWMVKYGDAGKNEKSAEDERRYVFENPHGGWLPELFQSAGIDYGRVDYAMLDGTPQIWEINTNPTLGPGLGRPVGVKRQRTPEEEQFHQVVLPARRRFYESFQERLEALDRNFPTSGPSVVLDLPQDLYGQWRNEMAHRARTGETVRRLSRLAALPVVRTVRPWLEPAVRRALAWMNR